MPFELANIALAREMPIACAHWFGVAFIFHAKVDRDTQELPGGHKCTQNPASL